LFPAETITMPRVTFLPVAGQFDGHQPEPITVEVDFALTIHADMAELCPGATRTAGRTVAFTHQDYREVFRGWRAMLNLSAVVE